MSNCAVQSDNGLQTALHLPEVYSERNRAEKKSRKGIKRGIYLIQTASLTE